MGDREQPRAQVTHIAAPPERAPGIDERLLHRILGVISHETAAVAQQQWLIAVDDRLKGVVVPGPCPSDQVRVALSPIEPRRSGRAARESAVG